MIDPRRSVKMLGRMTVGRVVAAADMAAGPTQAQMHPGRPGLQAFLAAERARRHVTDGVGVGAFVGHQILRQSAGARLCRRLRQEGVQRGHHLGAFADRGGDALDRARARVADREHAGQAGLQRPMPLSGSTPVRQTRARPASRPIPPARPYSDRPR